MIEKELFDYPTSAIRRKCQTCPTFWHPFVKTAWLLCWHWGNLLVRQWKAKVVMMPICHLWRCETIFSPPRLYRITPALQFVMMTICDAATDNKVGIMTMLSFQCQCKEGNPERYGWNVNHSWHHHCDGLVQDCSNSIADALELLQSCTKAVIYGTWENIAYHEKYAHGSVILDFAVFISSRLIEFRWYI